MPRNFEFRVIVFRPTLKIITLGLVRLEGFITFLDFQFKFLSIDITHRTRTNSSRKNEAKRKSINLSFNFIFIVEQTLFEKCPGTHYYRAKFLQNPLFLLFFVGNIVPDFQMPHNPLFFIIFVGK